jgi:hypothetical protein
MRCLVLLGEPGTGKSTELARIRAGSPAATPGGAALFIDLRAYDSISELRRDIVDSRRFPEWAEGEGVLTVYFDSLDEALLEIGPLSVTR